MVSGAVEVEGVPVDDRGGDEAQAGCPEADSRRSGHGFRPGRWDRPEPQRMLEH